MARYVMAIDAGTGSGRAVIYDLEGSIVGMAQEEWVHRSVPGVKGGLDFDTVANGFLIDRVIAGALAAARVAADAVAAVSTTSMREGVVLYDARGTVLWACPNVDARAQAEAEDLVRAGVADRIYALGGDWVSITSPARLRWIAKHHPDIIEKTRHLGLISDWLATRLTGEFFTEPSAGSSTALFDLKQRRWSDDLLQAIAVPTGIVPAVVEAGSPIGRVTPSAADRTGLRAGTAVIAGGADTQLALLGLGRRSGDATLVGGSFWQTTMLTGQPLVDADRGPRTLCHVRPDEWMVEGIGFLSGFSLRWLRDAFVLPLMPREQHDAAFGAMEALAAAQPPGSSGVYATFANPMQSDCWVHPAPGFVGFDLNHPENGIGAAVRAVMEAAAFVAHRHLDVLSRLSGRRFDTIQFTGGNSRGTLWPQIVADVLGRPVEVPVVKETTALGCAMLAAFGAGLYPSLDDAVSAMASPIERRIEPSPDASARYADIEAVWLAMNEEQTRIAARGLVEPLWRPAGARTGRPSAIDLTRAGQGSV